MKLWRMFLILLHFIWGIHLLLRIVESLTRETFFPHFYDSLIVELFYPELKYNLLFPIVMWIILYVMLRNSYKDLINIIYKILNKDV